MFTLTSEGGGSSAPRTAGPVFHIDPKMLQTMAPAMDRMLVVDPSPASARMLTELLHNIWPGQVWSATSTAAGLSLADSVDPRLIFVECEGPGLDGVIFTKKLRRSSFRCRKAPVIMVTAQATPGVILAARDSGVHEFLRKPYNNKDLVRRIEAVTRYQRGWVEAVGYVGPDRRRFNSAEYKGARKRQADAADSTQSGILQALKIVASAVHFVEDDPTQVRRSLDAQMHDLRMAAEAKGDTALAAATEALQDYLARVAAGKERLTKSGVEALAVKLLAFMPKQAEPKARSAA